MVSRAWLLVGTYPYHAVTGVISTLVILGFFFIYYQAGATTAFLDGAARLNMARRVYDNVQGTSSLAQLGSIWLPLMPALETPLVLSDRLYRTGIAGSIISMISFVGLALIVFESARSLTDRVVSGFAAALVLIVNLNVILFGTNTMAEMLLMAILAACGLCLIRLEQSLTTGTADIRWIFLASFGFMLVCLTRYEGYFVTTASVPLVGLMLWSHGVRGHQIIATVGTVFALPAISIAGWLVYEAVIYGDPLYFVRSEYSARSIDVINSDLDGPVGNPRRALQLYLDAVRWNSPDLILLLAFGGIAIMAWGILRSRATWGYGASYFLLVPAFYVVALTIGEIGLDPDPTSPYNIRYGLPTCLTVAVFAGYAVGKLASLRWRLAGRYLAIAAIILMTAISLPAWMSPIENTALLQDEGANLKPGSDEIAAWLDLHYDRGLILMDGFGGHKAYVQMKSGIPLGQFLTEAAPDRWHLALEHPSEHVRWIYIGNEADDNVGEAMAASPEFADRYVKVFENQAGAIYRLSTHRLESPS